MIYLDNAATTYPKPESVYLALDYAQRNLAFNSGRGSYSKSIYGISIQDDLRSEIASLCHGEPENVIILSSATEALNIIINGLNLDSNSNVYVSPFEHNAIIRPLFVLQAKLGINIRVLPFDSKTWRPDLERIQNEFALAKPTAVFCSQVSNVVGLKIDYAPIFALGKKYNSINVLDTAQGLGLVPLNINDVDFLVYAGHKTLFGPFGVGGFVTYGHYKLNLTKSGGNGSDSLNHFMPDSGHQRFESGSPNIPAFYGFLEALKWRKQHDISSHEYEITKYCISRLSNVSKIKMHLPERIDNVIGVISFNVDGYTADEVGEILNSEFNICIRTGYHCSPFVHEFISSTNQGGTDRISISYFTKKEDIDALISALETL